MRQFLYAGTFLWLTLLLGACDSGPKPSQVRGIAEQLMTTLKAGENARAVNLYAKEFYTQQTREQWQANLEGQLQEWGNMTAYRLLKSQHDTRYSGHFYIFEYLVDYQKKSDVRHTLTLFVDNSSADIKIVGHKIGH